MHAPHSTRCGPTNVINITLYPHHSPVPSPASPSSIAYSAYYNTYTTTSPYYRSLWSFIRITCGSLVVPIAVLLRYLYYYDILSL